MITKIFALKKENNRREKALPFLMEVANSRTKIKNPITSYGTATPNFPSITITNTQARVVRSLVKVGKKVAGNELRSATSRISTAATL
ncbi:hypothetical protein M0813_02375 [Anaeramoeba flamelloides]|uniref:Ribosomal protein S7 n=1 Tax=Anaeramoeba flamelloides TaxID=1746091 RepID=A0ABQ8YII5_9EUKA|nr:hypothetical protein M0813_02375 [Anaeramoeba flamelloides]